MLRRWWKSNISVILICIEKVILQNCFRLKAKTSLNDYLYCWTGALSLEGQTSHLPKEDGVWASRAGVPGGGSLGSELRGSWGAVLLRVVLRMGRASDPPSQPH